MKGFYFDEHVSRTLAQELVRRGVYVIMATDAGMRGKDDDLEHLPYATANSLVMVTFDHPFASRTTLRSDFYGLICLSRSIQTDIGRTVKLLESFALLFDPATDTGHVYYLP